MVSVQLAMVLVRSADWLKVTMRPILGNQSCCQAFFPLCEGYLLSSSGRFLMYEYLTLSGSGAVPFLSPESASGNSSSAMRSSFETVSVRVFCPTFFRLLSFHPDCSDHTAGRSAGIVLSLYPVLSVVLLYWHLQGQGW